MKLIIPYSEAIQVVKDKYGKDITLSVVNEKTTKVGYTIQVKIPLTNKYIFKEISFDVTYDKLVGEDLHLLYNGGTGLNMLVDGLKKFIPQLNNAELFELHEGNKAIVHLANIDNVHKALQEITINDVTFSVDGINILFKLK